MPNSPEPAWLVTRYDEQRTLLTDPRMSSDQLLPGFPVAVESIKHSQGGAPASQLRTSTSLVKSSAWLRRQSQGRAHVWTDLGFNWLLDGLGWARCRITDGTSEHQSSPSYLTNALADVLGGVAGTYHPGTIQRFSFNLEPREVRWVLRSRGRDVKINIYQFPDMFKSFHMPDDQGELSWSSVQPRAALSHVVVEAALGVLRLHGEDAYLKKWHANPFPVAELEVLRGLHGERDACKIAHELPV